MSTILYHKHLSKQIQIHMQFSTEALFTHTKYSKLFVVHITIIPILYVNIDTFLNIFI